MASSEDRTQFGSILVRFSTEGESPLDDNISKICNDKFLTSAALATLSAAKGALEKEIIEISKDGDKEYEDWIKNTKTVQDDINTSRKLAHEILQLAEEDEKYLNDIHEIKFELNHIKNEKIQIQDLLSVMRDVKIVYDEFLAVEKLVAERYFTSGLIKLQDTVEMAQRILHNRSDRVFAILDQRFSEMAVVMHEELLMLWETLVFVDTEHQRITISQSLPNEKLELSDVVTGLKFCDDIVKLSKDLCKHLDNMILKPRTMLLAGNLPSIDIKDSSILLGPLIDNNIQHLLLELKEMIKFLTQSLPPEIIRPLSEYMGQIFSKRILHDLLKQAAPSSPNEIIQYQKTMTDISEFARDLKSINWPGFDCMQDWAEKFPKVWLNWCLETSLEWIRNQILSRAELPLRTEKVEMVIHEKDQRSPTKPASASANEEWNAAWDADDDLVTEKSNVLTKDVNDRNQEKTEFDKQVAANPLSNNDNLDDENFDAWGWGDEDAQDTFSETQHTKKDATEPHAEVVASAGIIGASELDEIPCIEECWITEWPRSILAKITEILEDYVSLSLDEGNPVFSHASGLLALPAQLLAMHRAVSPSFYANHINGNMFCHNDSIWLAGKLKSLKNTRMHRSDISPEFPNAIKIDNDASLLESFGRRALASELKVQKDVVQNMLGGNRNFFQQENSEMEQLLDSISSVTLHINKVSNLWRSIMTFSCWASAVGAVVNTVATKIINDVLLLPNISVDGIERIVSVISRSETLDDLFVYNLEPKDAFGLKNNDESEKLPVTSNYADKWIKMKFLSEVLKSSLTDVKFLWYESDLSLYFSVEEIVRLIKSSFVMNERARKVIKEIREGPGPRINGM